MGAIIIGFPSLEILVRGLELCGGINPLLATLAAKLPELRRDGGGSMVVAVLVQHPNGLHSPGRHPRQDLEAAVVAHVVVLQGRRPVADCIGGLGIAVAVRSHDLKLRAPESSLKGSKLI